jgi:hypothetical protein
MDLSKLTLDELRAFLRFYNYSEEPDVLTQAEQLLTQLQTQAQPEYTLAVTDLLLAQNYLDRGGELNDTYSELQINLATSEEISAFAQVFGLPLQDSPMTRLRIVRIIRILGILVESQPGLSPIETHSVSIVLSPTETRLVSIEPEVQVTVVNDGVKFPFGTKQRIASNYITLKIAEGYQEFIYAGPSTAMGAYALANGCVEQSVRCTLFLTGPFIPPQGQGFPENLVTINLLHTDLATTDQTAREYVGADPTRLLVPFGLNDPLYKDLLRTSLFEDPDLAFLWTDQLNDKRMWLAAGSGVLLSILLELLPQTHFMVVLTGKTVYLDQLTSDPQLQAEYQNRLTFFDAREYEKFTQPAEFPPPYSSLLNYDAKIWRFVLQSGQDGDLIWNVARDYGYPTSRNRPGTSGRGGRGGGSRGRGQEGRGGGRGQEGSRGSGKGGRGSPRGGRR